MPQIFHPSTNTISRVTMVIAVPAVVAFGWLAGAVVRSPWVTGAGVVLEQPVPFSHAHHVGEIGIDCRYCHGTAETTAFAGMPSTETCMNCHRQLWVESRMLEPVRASFREDRPLHWVRVHDLADFVYFNHGAHVRKGVGCVTCHGRVDRMPLVWREASLYMEWCLECHRQPERFLRPRERVFEMDWEPPADSVGLGARLVEEYGVRRLTDCTVCHR